MENSKGGEDGFLGESKERRLSRDELSSGTKLS